MKPNYYLIGPTGAGKSFLGPPLADRLGLGFIDSDAAIVAATGYRTDQLLNKFGEAHLRRCEADFLENHPKSGYVIACGAGTITLDAFEARLPQPHVLAYLQASLDTLVQRIAAQTSQRRVLLEGPEGLPARLAALLESRSRFHDYPWPLRLSTDELSVGQVLEALVRHYWFEGCIGG